MHGEKELLIKADNEDSSIESNVQAKQPIIRIVMLPFSQKQKIHNVPVKRHFH